MDTAALHADIFGEDSDDDDEFVPPTHAAPGDGSDDDDAKADAILEAAQNNALLVSKKDRKKGEKKERKKKDDADIGRGGKRKSKPSADEMASRGAKRLKKNTGGEAGGSGDAVGGEEGAGGADDPDDDSVAGDQAVEEGKKGDFERIMQGLKHKRGGTTVPREKIVTDVKALQERMEEAYELDVKACEMEPPQPAVAKVAMLADVEKMLLKKQYHEVMIDHSMLSTLSSWLRPLPDGSLPSLMVRAALLKALMRFEIDETTLGSLRSSGIGKFVKLYTLHKRETKENRKIAMALVEKWSRPIFQTSDKVRAEELPVASRPLEYNELAGRSTADPEASLGALSRETQSTAHARVPRPMGMDFAMLPASSAKPLPSARYAKDSTKGRLQDRIHMGKRKVSTQAVTLSVEGRVLDKV